MNKLNRSFVILDTPYRLKTVISDIDLIMPNRDIFIGFNLTMDDEKHFRGNAKQILGQINEIAGEGNLKGEFVIVINKLYDKHSEIQQ